MKIHQNISKKIALLTVGIMASTTLSSGVLAAPAGNPPGSNTPAATFSALSVGGFSVDTFGRLAHTSGAVNFLTNRISSAVGGTWALWLTNNTSSTPGTAGNLSNPTIYAQNTGDSMAGYFTSPSQQATLTGENTYPSGVGGAGLRGLSTRGAGVTGSSADYYGVYGTSTNAAAVYGAIGGTSNNSSAVVGQITNTNSIGAAVYGGTLSTSTSGKGVHGYAAQGTGVIGQTTTGYGVTGLSSSSGVGVSGSSVSNAGMVGTSTSGVGVSAVSSTGTGVYGTSTSGRAVMGSSSSNDGVWGGSTSGTGVRASANGANAALAAENTSTGSAATFANNSNSNPGVFVQNANTTSSAIGVGADTSAGTAISGSATTGYALRGIVSNSGTGVYGLASSTSAGNAATFVSNLPYSGYTNLTLNRNGLDFALSQPELAGTTVDFEVTNDGLSVVTNDNGNGATAIDHVLQQNSAGTTITSYENASGMIQGAQVILNRTGTYGLQLAGPNGIQFGEYDNGPTYTGAASFKARLNMASTGELSSPSGNVTIADAMDVTSTLEAPTIRTATDGFRAYSSGITYVGGTLYSYAGITNPSSTVEPDSGGYVYINDGFRVNSSVTQKLSNTAWTTWSDGRLKDIQKTFDKGLAEIMKIDPIIYKYKKDNALGIKDDGDHVGIIAQEIQKVFPEAVTTDEKGFLQFTPDSIYWAMLNAIKELNGNDEVLKAKITTLEAQNKALEARLSALEAKIK